jgi:hypothetical protein
MVLRPVISVRANLFDQIHPTATASATAGSFNFLNHRVPFTTAAEESRFAAAAYID